MAIKRTTMQEKCDIMLGIFRQKRDFFSAKEIEKLSVKKGILERAVKEVLQSLVDDNLVTHEKLGISNYYWSFVQDEGLNAKEKKERLLNEQTILVSELELLQKNIISESKGRETSEERTKMIKEYTEALEVVKETEAKLEAFAECDPRVYARRKEEIGKLKEEINKVTEDLFVIRDYVCNKFGLARGDFNQNFGLDEEMDLLD